MQQMQRTQIDHEQFAHIIGRAKQYLNLPKDLKATKENFPLGDSQRSQMIREYYQAGDEPTINLWDFYNLMTSANKSSYIDSHVDRVVESFRFTQNLGKSLENQLPNWYTHSIYNN